MEQLRTFFFCVREGMYNLKRGGFRGIIAMLIIAFTLTNVGLFLLLTDNVAPRIANFIDKPKIIAYLKDDIHEKRIKELGEELKAIEEIGSTSYIGKKEAQEQLKKVFSSKEDEIFLQGLEENILPASYELVIKNEYSNDNERMKNLYEHLEARSEFSDVIGEQKGLSRVTSFIFLIKSIGYAIGMILLIISIFIIANTMRLSFYHKREQVDIMRLVGASKYCIKGPFFIEGLVEGLVGGILSVCILYLCYLGIKWKINPSIFTILGHGSPVFLSSGCIFLLVFLGMAVGGGGSLFLSS
ncbi:MAG: cell division protein FtsX [bacterium]